MPELLRRHHQEIGAAAGEAAMLYAELTATHPRIDTVLADLAYEPRPRAANAAQEPGAAHLACELIRLGAGGRDGFRLLDGGLSGLASGHRTGRVRPAAALPVPWHARGLAPDVGGSAAPAAPGTRRHDPARPACLIAVPQLSHEAPGASWLGVVCEAAATHNVVDAAATASTCYSCMSAQLSSHRSRCRSSPSAGKPARPGGPRASGFGSSRALRASAGRRRDPICGL